MPIKLERIIHLISKSQAPTKKIADSVGCFILSLTAETLLHLYLQGVPNHFSKVQINFQRVKIEELVK